MNNLGAFRKMRLVNLIVCLAFCLNLGLSGNALASGRVEKASESMLRPKPASLSERLENVALQMGIQTIKDILREKGSDGLRAELANLALGEDAVKTELTKNEIGILQREGKTYVVCLIGDGWRLDLSKDENKVEPFASRDALMKFISDSQLTWIAGSYTPEEIEHIQREVWLYLKTAGEQGRIFRRRDLKKAVAAYSVKRVPRDLPTLDKKQQEALVKRLEPKFVFHDRAIDSLTQDDVDAMFAGPIVKMIKKIPTVNEIKEDLKKVDPAFVLDEEGKPSFWDKGEVGTAEYAAVTLSSGGFEYPGFEAVGIPARSTYDPLDMTEAYMEMEKTDPQALRAYGLKTLHDYFEVSEKGAQVHRWETAEVVDLINQYDDKAFEMWKQREAAKAKAKSESDKLRVVEEVTQARIDKFLGPEADEVIPLELINVAKAELQKLVEEGTLTDYNVWANGGDINMHTFRRNKNAITDDPVVLQELVKVYSKVLDEAKRLGIYKYKDGDLSDKPFKERVRALEIRRGVGAMRKTERPADPQGVFSLSHACVGAWNGTVWAAYKDRMKNAGLTIDPTMTRGYMFTIWDAQKNTVFTLDSQTQEDKIAALIKQIGRYAAIEMKSKPEGKLPADETQIYVSVRYVADDGKSEIGDANPVLVMTGQSGDPAWGELLTRDAEMLPRLVFGGNKTRNQVVLTPTTMDKAREIRGSLSKNNAIFCGYGFQLHNYRMGKPDDIMHQTYDFTKENADKWAQIFTKLPWFMSHLRQIEPYLWQHAYSRPNSVTQLYDDLIAKGRFTDLPAEPKNDPLVKGKKGDYGMSNIKVDIGSKPGHKYPLPSHFRAAIAYLTMARVYGFKGVAQYDNLARIAMILTAGLDIEELVGEKGVFRSATNGADKVLEKVNDFRKKVTIADWEQALEFLKQKTKDENLISLLTKLKDSQVNYADFIAKIKESAQKDALAYYALEYSRKTTAEEVEILSAMVGLSAGSALEWIKQDANLRQVLGLTEDLANEEKISSFRVWAVGDDIQLTMWHNLQSNAPQIHTLAYNNFRYTANQVSYFKPYGWKQDILVEKMPVSGNLQGLGPGLAEVQVLKSLYKAVMIISADKSAPGALTVPIIGMVRQALKAGRFPNGLVFRVFDMNHKKHILFYVRSEEDEQFKEMMTLLSSPEEFAIKGVYEPTRVWDGKEPLENLLADVTPFIDASTERLVLTAGKYVGKDDPTMIVLISKIRGRGLTKKMAVEVFRYVQLVNGWMRGSHTGPSMIGEIVELDDFIKGTWEGKFKATPVDFDGPPPMAAIEFPVGQDLSEGKDVFSRLPWFRSVIRKALFVSKVVRNNGLFSPHGVEGEEAEYTNLPEIMGSIEALGLEKPASNEQDALLLKAALGLQSKGIVNQYGDDVFDTAKDIAKPQVVVMSLKALRSDPSLLLALESTNEQINQTLGVFGSTANIKDNAYRFMGVADDLELKTDKDVEHLFADITGETHNGARGNKEMFAKILTQEDMNKYMGKGKGDISNPADLVQLLKLMGIVPESLKGFVGAKEWTTKMKAQSGVFEKAIAMGVDAEENKVAFAGNGLFGVIETIAARAHNKELTSGMREKLDLLVTEPTSMEVKPKEISTEVADVIDSYRKQVGV